MILKSESRVEMYRRFYTNMNILAYVHKIYTIQEAIRKSWFNGQNYKEEKEMNDKNILKFQTEVRNGPEFAPLRDYVKSFKIKVTVYNQNDDIIRIEVMDYGKAEDRIWLGKISFWGWSNGHYIETEKCVE